MNKLLPQMIGLIVATSSTVAFEAAVKVMTPAGVHAVKGFLIKGVATVVGGMIAGKLSSMAIESTNSIMDTVDKTAAEIEAPEVVTVS